MKSAVLVIDVQQVLFDPFPQPFEAEQVVARINQVIAWARNNKLPVILVQHEQADSIIEQGSEGWKLQGNLQSEPTDPVIRKLTPDSFLKTSLENVLKALEIEHLIICGYASEFCVDTTARRAVGLGYPVTLVADAHTTHDKAHATGEEIRAHHNATLSNILSFGIGITTITTECLVS